MARALPAFSALAPGDLASQLAIPQPERQCGAEGDRSK